ncbi:hypothetical protein HDU84_002449 [Entophlyctis sp. JEL0112]|nr:hypothetical protein HDU84_002449 [Entophlyctis sp. JEL0112]
MSMLQSAVVLPTYGKRIVVGYLTEWSNFSAAAVNYAAVTNLHYCFANIALNGSISVPSGLADMVTIAHANSALATLTFGGWESLSPFSILLASNDGRIVAVQEIAKVVVEYGLDGVEMDWEYPGKLGGSQMPFNSSSDTENYLLFLQSLRLALGNSVLISACGQVTPFIGSDQRPLADTRPFAQVLNFLVLMVYDLNGPWDNYTAPNSPLQASLNLNTNPSSVVQAIQTWSESGFPSEQLVLAIPFYGRSSIVKESMANNLPTNETAQINPSSTSETGTYSYVHILELKTDRSGNYITNFDTDTMTPWIFSLSNYEYISYDDARSIAAKVKYSACTGLAGVAAWDLSLDGGQLIPYLAGIQDESNSQSCLISALSTDILPQMPTQSVDPCVTILQIV